jgi:hypothetical protein
VRIEEAHDTLLDPSRRRAYDLSTFPEPESKPEVFRDRRLEATGAELVMLRAELLREINAETQFTGALLRLRGCVRVRAAARPEPRVRRGPDGVARAGGPRDRNAEAGRIALASTRRDGLTLRAEAALVRAGCDDGSGRPAAHGPDFERAARRACSARNEAVRVVFGAPVSLKGVAEASASRIQATSEGGDVGGVSIQLDFAERTGRRPATSPTRARNAEKKGDLGECLAKWSELLNDVPFDDALVAEGDQKRASLVQQGLFELQAVRLEVDRAKFFRLVDLDRRCKSRARGRREVQGQRGRRRGAADRRRHRRGPPRPRGGSRASSAPGSKGSSPRSKRRRPPGFAAEVRAHLEKMPKRPGDAAHRGLMRSPRLPRRSLGSREKGDG